MGDGSFCHSDLDRIGRIFASRAIDNLGLYFGKGFTLKITEVAQIAGLLFPTVPAMYWFWQKNRLGSFWVTHVATLTWTQSYK
jgi:hypothetical protein